MHIDHINIAAPADLLETVRAFYCEVLGLKDGFRPRFGQNGYWLYAGDKAIVHLSESERHRRKESPGYLDHVAFQTSGLKSMIARLDANRIEYRSNHIPEFNMTQLFFTDPAGTGLEVNFPDET